jgi:hypothetical protein
MDTLDTFTDLSIAAARQRDAVRVIRLMAEGGNIAKAFNERYARDSMHAALVQDWWATVILGKAAISGLSDATLLPSGLSQAIVAAAADTGIVNRLGGPVVGFGAAVAVEDEAITAGFVEHGFIKPVGKAALHGFIPRRKVCAALTVVSNELLRFGGAEPFLSRRLSVAAQRAIDAAFCNPAHPLSLLSGVSATAGTGDPVSDIKALLADYLMAGGRVESAVLVLSSGNAAGAKLSGNASFDGLTVTGGTAAGIRALASDSVGASVILLDAEKVVVADQGELAVSTAAQASINMTDDGGSPVETSVVSMFQTNSTALRAERYIDWHRGGAASFVESADYSAVGSPA